MAVNDYHFITKWRVESTVEEVAEVLGNATDLPRWWPAVYLQVEVLEPGDEQNKGQGQVVSLYTKGWLPYTLRWQFKSVENYAPHGFVIEARGDFVGKGVWTFEQDGPYVNIIYDWRIKAEKPLLRRFSFLLKPVFSLNHRWAMHKGEESLRLELARRKAKTDSERARISSPPPATTTSSLPLLLGFLTTGAAILVLLQKLLYKRPPDLIEEKESGLID
ncbi:MAG TPA: SRPBCC family protein [Chloroflexia bacterium]|nr:SRPBCC family protein [Chloroflexia bacterium]